MSTTEVSAGRRRGPWRWLVALLATVLLVVSGSGLVAFAQSGSGAGRGPAFVPADAPVYVVGRLDMPDGQGQALAEFMSAFPGFADPSAFQMKLDELVDGAVSSATDGALSFSGEIENFVTGEVGLAILDFSEAAISGEDPDLLVGIAISDRAAAESFVDLLTAAADDAVEESYGSTSVISSDDNAIAVTDEWILAAQTADQVKVGIDVLDGNTASLAEDEQFATAFARVPSGHLAAVYMNLQSFGSLIELAGSAAPGPLGSDAITEDLLAQLPIDMTAYLSASSDRLTLEAFITPSEAMPSLAMGESDLATLFPADTQLYVETRELGSLLELSLTGLLDQLEEEQAAQMAPFESMLGTPLPSFFDFIADASVGASLNSDGLWVGIAAEVNDEATAATRVERLLTLIRLVGSQGSGISITEASVGDATVTTITLPIDDIAGGAGMPIDIGDTISIAVADGTLLIGTGDFVTDALAQEAVGSLALSPGYADALGDDTANAGVLYANISALLTEIDPLIGFMVPEWSDIQPYATGIDRLIAVGSVDEVISTRISVIVDR
ncbi:MAG: DUF3352 domain-containing protein [Chloroflexota bacterium]